MENKTIEFYDRGRNIVRVGTFVPVTDETFLAKGQLYIVPPDETAQNGKMGCVEGREHVSGYMLPIMLTIRYVGEHHIRANNGYGSWRKDRCFVEVV